MTDPATTLSALDLKRTANDIKLWGAELGFQQVVIGDVDLSAYRATFLRWLENGFHGAMGYMANNTDKRLYPERLQPGTIRVISVRMDYARQRGNSLAPMHRRNKAYIARYARGRDYHKLMRKRLQILACRITEAIGEFGYRAFVDSAPVLERAMAEKSGLGWIGKNTMLINRQAGSWFFLGELFTDIPLPIDPAGSEHCGSCRACLDICPTRAFIGNGQMDARRCISYLTIELRTAIPVKFRKAIGNRVFGCDDCQLVCPWNKFSTPSPEQDFSPRHGLDDADLVALFAWSEDEFLTRTEGSAIRRIGYECWQRNLAVALGNAETSDLVMTALQNKLSASSPLVAEHIKWALHQHRGAEGLAL
ncbi:MAG: tRNA epoxyqueuosine(34) reductase QueG [Gammaproteobacteria bacterium]|nr:tRNA epoxyqueuosine(34) reductase QueG [Gammaproteobacteria bacterium]MCY4358086.1 tRNA epoxyqueuosine(34) reductase QueG [Gammaproteobacteria bacterium]